MNITISENLKRLRNEKGNTQDDLARHLGISMQAVSKWERSEGYPDITLIPAIALYYDVSADTLLGMDDITVKAKVDDYVERGFQLRRQGNVKENLALFREAQKEFPNNHTVLQFLMYALAHEENSTDERVAICERILNESNINMTKQRMITSLCGIYIDSNDFDSAQKYALMLPNARESMEYWYGCCLSGEESVKWNQQSIRTFIDMTGDFVNIICNTGGLSAEEKIQAFKFNIELLQLVYSDGDYGYEEYRMSRLYYKLAVCEASLDKIDTALTYLETAADHIKKYDNCIETEAEIKYTSPMVSRLTYDSKNTTKHHTCNETTMLIERIKSEPAFDSIRENERYKQITNK
jgi:Predicted transcriptional regulators